MGRGPGKLGGDVAVTISSQSAPGALGGIKKASKITDVACQIIDLTNDPQCFRLDSKVCVCETVINRSPKARQYRWERSRETGERNSKAWWVVSQDS